MRTIENNGKTLIIALLVGIIALGAGIAVAHSNGTEIRITAMRHDDGRIEFAVQERDGEGWGERVLPRSRFFPASGREGRWLSSTPITVGVVDTATSAATDLVVTDFEWETSTYAFSGGIRNVTGSAVVTNNTGALLTEWWAEMTCADAGNAKVAAAEPSGFAQPPLRDGESARVQFVDYGPSAIPTNCNLGFWGEVDLTAASSASGETPHLIVENFDWETVAYSHGQVPDITASVVVRNNTGETLSEWSAAMRCRDETDSIVAYDQITVNSWSGVGVLGVGESARLEFTDAWPQGTPANCEVSFRGRIELTH